MQCNGELTKRAQRPEPRTMSKTSAICKKRKEIASAVQYANNQHFSSAGLKKDQIALVHTAANVSAEFGARWLGEWGCCNPLAMLTDIAD